MWTKIFVFPLLLFSIEVDYIKASKTLKELLDILKIDSGSTLVRKPEKCSDPDKLPCSGYYPLRCIKKSYFCDNDPDCPNGSDEVGCNEEPCPSGKRECGIGNYQCVYDSFWCDGDRDCYNGEDEAHCQLPLSTGKNVSITKANSLSIEIVNPNQTVTIGSTFTLSCRITGSNIASAFWYHKDHGGFWLTWDNILYVDANRYSLYSPTFPVIQQNFFYNLTISHATFEDTGYFVCGANVRSLSSYKQAMVVMSGVPEVPASPVKSLFISAGSRSCCREKVESVECNELLCTSSDAAMWQPARLTKCLRYVSVGLKCMADGQNTFSCCLQSGVSVKCRILCNAYYIILHRVSERTYLDCADEWEKVARCFSRANQRTVDPPFGVTARALNSSAAEVSWLITNEIYHTVRFAVYCKEYNSTLKLSDVETKASKGWIDRFNRLDSTSETSLIVNNLKPMTRYVFFVIAFALSGSGSSPSAVVEAITSPDFSNRGNNTGMNEGDLGQCCKRHKIDTDCASWFCTLNHTVATLQSVVERGLNCSSDMPKMLTCLAGKYDHSKCCKLRHVPGRCLKFCVGHLNHTQPQKYDSFRHKDLLCLPYLNSMASCFADHKLPPPPDSLRVTFQLRHGSNSIYPSIAVKVEWRKPINYSGKVTRYLISLTHLSTSKLSQSDVSGSFNSYTLTEPFVKIEFDSRYYLQLAAENEFGYSLDVETAFTTPKRSNHNSRQSSVTDSIRSCCKTEKLPKNCTTYCTSDVTQFTWRISYSRQGSKQMCFNDNWPTYAKCSALGNDISDCCAAMPKTCRKFCRTSGKITFSSSEKWMCRLHFQTIISCAIKKWPVLTSITPKVDNIMVPLPPTHLSISNNPEVFSATITVSWWPPRSGSAFSKYIVSFKAGGDRGQEDEITVEPSITIAVIDNLTPNTRYWVRVFTETHLGTRSKPSVAKSIVTKIPYLSSTTVPEGNITNVDECCHALSRNCEPMCIGVLGILEKSSEIISRCTSEMSQISRCSVFAIDVEAMKVNKSVSLTGCCKGRGVINKECCSVPTTANDLKPLPTCDNATSLAIIRNCVSEQLKSIGPTVIRDLNAKNITATRASLTWLAPQYNIEKVAKYVIQCQYNDIMASSGWSELIYTKIQGSLTSFKFGEDYRLKASTQTRCSLWVDGFESTKAEIMFESKDVDMKELELKLTDPDSTFLHSPAEFQCITGEFAYSNITWLKAPFGNTFDKQMLPETMVSSNSTTLKIPRLEVNHSGVYTCKLGTSSSRQAPVYLSASLKVQIKPQQVQTNVTVLPCGFSGFPDRILILKKTLYNNEKMISKKMPSMGFYVTNMTTIPVDDLSQPRNFENGVSRVIFDVIASNVKGSSICKVSYNHPNITIKSVPGWTNIDGLCKLVDQDDCCMLVEENCPNICSLATNCAVNVPISCLPGFKQCARQDPSIIPPDLSGRLTIKTSSVKSPGNPFNETSVTRVSVAWREGLKPAYLSTLNYLVAYESMYDPHGPYLSLMKSIDIILPVPSSNYSFNCFSMNGIGQTSRRNATETVISLKQQGLSVSLSSGRLPVSSRNAAPMLRFFWNAGMCIHLDWCHYTYVYLRPISRPKESGKITPIGAYKEYQFGYRLQNAYIIDPYPNNELVVLVCIGNSNQSCTYSEPQFIPVLLEGVHSKDNTSVTVLFIILGFIVIAAISFIGYKYGSRIFCSVTDRPLSGINEPP